ncbi:MAG: protein phosphatase CheZ [Thermodesulfobacteriota bacterium]
MVDHEGDKEMADIIARLTEHVVGSVGEAITRTVQEELSRTLPRALREGEFFRKVNADMRRGLQEIYKEIVAVKRDTGQAQISPKDADKLFSEASDQLDAILKSTESATVQIMDIVEDFQDNLAKTTSLVDSFRSGGASKKAVEELAAMNASANEQMVQIMTALSFQDLTGQRIKRVIQALQHIERIVFEVYMSTGLLEKARDERPERDMSEMEAEAKQRVSALKGPQAGTSQNDVDDLLAQLGLE